MGKQTSAFTLEFIAAGSPRALELFPTITGGVKELVAITDEGDVYRGDDAFLICLYALDAYRSWSYRLARPALRPFARRAFEMLSTNRTKISELLSLAGDEAVVCVLERDSVQQPEVAVW
jgi:predicted DCC family thiol-disulfide oxidoreductase YuxK